MALWRIDQPTAKLKICQYLIRVYTYIRKINNGCGRSRASARARAHCRSQLFFDVHARRCKILLLLTMSLYRFFTKAGMPSRVPSLSDKEIENASAVRTCGLSARVWAWLYSPVNRPPNLNPPIFLFTLVGANPPNLMPAKFSGYTVANFKLVYHSEFLFFIHSHHLASNRSVGFDWFIVGFSVIGTHVLLTLGEVHDATGLMICPTSNTRSGEVPHSCDFRFVLSAHFISQC